MNTPLESITSYPDRLISSEWVGSQTCLLDPYPRAVYMIFLSMLQNSILEIIPISELFVDRCEATLL